MIDITYVCDFGGESVTGTDQIKIPSGWVNVNLQIGSLSASYLVCPLHQDLVIVEAAAAPAPPVQQIDISAAVSKHSLGGGQ